MSLEEYKDSKPYKKIYEQVEKLGLVDYINHLDEEGYVVIPPELVAPAEFHDRIRQAVCDVQERRNGQRIDPDKLDTESLKDASGNVHWGILTEDPVFQEAIMNPTVLAMGKYLCGNSAILSEIYCLLKQKSEKTLKVPLHTDQHGTPPPIPPYA